MSTFLPSGIATRVADIPLRPHAVSRVASFLARMSGALWLRDRGVSEMRWGATTLAVMAFLAFAAGLLDQTTTVFDRAVLLAGPSSILLGLLAWSPVAPLLGRTRLVRQLLGPAVLTIVFLSTGLADIETLRLPPGSPMVLLAMAFAAMTPGYAYAVVVLIGASTAVVISHAQILAAGQVAVMNDQFAIGFSVALLMSAGMAVIIRLTTEAEVHAAAMAAWSKERVDILERVNRIVARFDGSQPVAEVIQAVVDDIAREFDIPLVSMYLPVEPGRLVMVGMAGYPTPFQEIEVGVGIIGRAAATKQTQFVPDVLRDPDYRASRDDVRSEVAAPVVHSGELLGVMNFEGTAEDPIGSQQLALAEVVIRALSTALRSARFDDERRDRLYAIERVLAVSRSLVADLDRPRIVASISETVAELLAADVVALFSSGIDGVYRLEAGVGFPLSAIGFEVQGRSGLVGRAITERARIDGLHEVEAWPIDFLPDRPGDGSAHAAMALPIVVDDAVAAVLFVTRVGPHREYSDLERAIADLLTAQVAIALQNADLHARVAESALRDPLTGLLNRRFFDEAVEAAYANARRTNLDLSLIVLDLDKFSDVNNEHGHSVGDSVLRRVARSIKSAVREGDVVIRYGGEEFVVIAPATDGDGAVRAAERIREAVASRGSEPIDGRLVPLTISAGVASLVDETDGRGLFRAADSALLAAKRGGRDRVTRI